MQQAASARPRARAKLMLFVFLLGLLTAVSQVVAVAPVRAATTVAADKFSRTVSSNWGQARHGGTWEVSSPASAFTVSNGRGYMFVDAAGATRSALLPTARARDVTASVRISTDKSGSGHGQFVYLVLRRNSSGSEYRMGLRLAAGSAYLQAVRMSGSTGVQIGQEVKASNVSHAAGSALRFRAEAFGAYPTALRMKVWTNGTTEPAAWSFSGTDSTAALQASGSVGIRSYVGSNASNAPVLFKYDNYSVTTAEATPPAPSGKYVSTTGADSNDGSYSKPWRTLQRAADIGTGVINIRGGTYAGFSLRRSGLTFVAYPGESVTVSGGTNVIDIFRITSGTIRGLTVRGAAGPRGSGILVGESSNVVIDGNLIRDNRSYGIRTWYSTDVTIKNNEVTKNDEGIYISYRATGTRILDNLVHHNDRMIDPTRRDAGGGVGIAFVRSTGAVEARGNRVWGNRAPDGTYGYDGGGFEIFGASDLTITENVIWDNKHVMETGTADGLQCNNNRFTRNVAYAASSAPGYAHGLLFACMSNSLVANNTLRGFDQAAVNVVFSPGYPFQGSLDGLKLRNNIFVSDGPNVYYFDNVPSTVSIDRNYLWNRGGTRLAYVVGTGTVSSLANLRSATGFDNNSFLGDPGFLNLGANDYHLLSASPAIDKGWTVTGVTEGYLGPAPDIGRYETR